MRPLRLHPRLAKRGRRGFRGFPAATVAFYGPDDSRATKVVASIVPSTESEPTHQVSFAAEEGDLREDAIIGEQLLAFAEKHDARSVVVVEEILGCPHEEGIDYPAGTTCPACPFWAERDRWAGTKERLGEMRGELLREPAADPKEPREGGGQEE